MRTEIHRPADLRRVATSLLIAAMLSPSAARADSIVQLGLDTFATWLPNLPDAVSSDGLQADLRSIPAARIPLGGSNVFVGAGFSLGLALGRHFAFDLVGLEAAGSVARTDDVLGGVDGTIVEARGWSSALLGVRGPGLVYRFAHRRFQLQLRVDAGYHWLEVPVSASLGASTADVIAEASSVYARAQADLCFRFDYRQRGCIFVAANIYDFGYANGGSAGLRWEFGR